LQFVFASEPCVVKRHALYDLGSGSSKMSVVQTNSCAKTPETLLTGFEKVDYKEDLTQSKNSEFSEQVQKAGLEALKKLKDEAVKFNPDEHRGIATAAFREAGNAHLLIERIKSELSIPIEIISQEQEGRLAYQAVRLYHQEPSVLVWDIGGASFQLTAFDSITKEWSVYKGTLAAVVFKDLIMTRVKKKPAGGSPNPMTLAEIKKARKIVHDEIAKDLNGSFAVQKKFAKVVGIGGVLALNQKKNLQKAVFTVADVEAWIKKNHRKTDAELKDKYASTVISSMILVSEMMKILKIDSVEVFDIALAEGLLAKPY
jgi:exopolyphosphatase/guanosine-5'-triphosphate,3'-diphosphate pyrophosphatase